MHMLTQSVKLFIELDFIRLAELFRMLDSISSTLSRNDRFGRNTWPLGARERYFLPRRFQLR